MSDFLFRGTLADLDSTVHQLNQIEAERQYHKLILIASESSAPMAVREALNSAFNNLYAEGYPDDASRWMSEIDIIDYTTRLGHYRRYANPRYYKGVEYCDTVEALARRRGAELFANERVSADDIYTNVQALSGGAANNAVYHALIEPGDTVMGMDLMHGGHLSHGARVNRSGKYYNSVSYGIDPETEKINYESVRDLAREHKPKLLIAGYSSYPWVVDWEQFRSIAAEVGAFLLADIAHVAGLVAAGEYPSPVGIADVVTFTTHKSLCGPRGACILTTDRVLARKIDRAVFPGEQGGPHMNVIAAIAVVFKLNRAPEFRHLQQQVRANATRMATRLGEHGFKVPFGGTDTHMLNIDCKSVRGPDGTPLMGDAASRILDIANVVANRNTIPGDRSALNPSGLRFGTVWLTQRGFREAEIDELTDLMAQLLQACQPYGYDGHRGRTVYRAKVDFDTLNAVKIQVRDLSQRMGLDFTSAKNGYPHFYYLDQQTPESGLVTLEISGEKAERLLQFASSNDTSTLPVGANQPTQIWQGKRNATGVLGRTAADTFKLTIPAADSVWLKTWLRDLSDGYVTLDGTDLHAKAPGAVAVHDCGVTATQPHSAGPEVNTSKPYFNGITAAGSSSGKALPEFRWSAPESDELLKTRLHDSHISLGARMAPFAGWDMPLWYSSVSDEHAAVRNTAGLFDISHMGVWEATGATAAEFLDSVCANDISTLGIGNSLYSHFLDPDADVIDDLMVYRHTAQRYLIMVNASNDAKDWAWVNGVLAGSVLVDRQRPESQVTGRGGITLRNLRDRSSGAEMRVGLALQGPQSLKVLLALLDAHGATAARLQTLKRTCLCEATLGDLDLLVSRTGYTGEPIGFELLVHPDRAVDLWSGLLKAGKPFRLQPCGLAARDSTRTEAGLPLYGHEFGGDLNLGVAASGFGSYVKTHKPWFIGRTAFMARDDGGVVVRFRFREKSVRMAHPGDPVLHKRGRVIGQVTSCAIDSEGYLLGHAFVEPECATPGTPLAVFQSASEETEQTRATLKTGDRVQLSTWATVLPRFMKKK
ncbi:MAG: serine hydroxymethyltransferase [Anaerolineales bacterium]|nr:serine hydroxymethyltransferase [Anaerolineales bacterium]